MTGPTGATGPTGPTGPTGATGPTGTLSSIYAYVVFNDTQGSSVTVNSGATVVQAAGALTGTLVTNTSEITFVATTGLVTIDDTGVYLIMYGVANSTATAHLH